MQPELFAFTYVKMISFSTPREKLEDQIILWGGFMEDFFIFFRMKSSYPQFSCFLLQMLLFFLLTKLCFAHYFFWLVKFVLLKWDST